MTLAFTTGFSFEAFIAVVFYDVLPMLVSGIGIIAGLIIMKNRSRNMMGSLTSIVSGLIPIAVLYDVARTIIVYGS